VPCAFLSLFTAPISFRFFHICVLVQCRPEIFKSTALDDSSGSLNITNGQLEENELESSDDDGLPPLEANMNRIKPPEWEQSDTESNSGSDTDS